jgi:signal transduction histidine kinase
MKTILKNQEIDKIVEQARKIASGNYKKAVSTATNHANLQALQIKINAELSKTIRHLDEKNEKLQKLLFWLSIVATVATIAALLK